MTVGFAKVSIKGEGILVGLSSVNPPCGFPLPRGMTDRRVPTWILDQVQNDGTHQINLMYNCYVGW